MSGFAEASAEERSSLFHATPQVIEVEKHVIGALMLDPEAVDAVTARLKADDFYLERHAAIFEAILELQMAKRAPDIIEVGEQLKKRKGRFESAGGESYLMEIATEVVSSANVEQHSDLIRDKSLMRKAIFLANRILRSAYEDGGDSAQVIKQAEEGIYQLSQSARGGKEGLVDMRTAVMRTAKQYDDVANGKPNRIRMGVPAIDDITRGLRFGSLNLLAARPGVGKSALALQAIVECGLPAPLFSLEMMIEEEVERMAAQLDPNLNADGLSSQAQVIAKRAALAAALEKISNYPIEICDSSDISTQFIRSEVLRMKRKHGKLGPIVVDYLQLVKAMGRHSRRDLEVGSVSGDLKQIANEAISPVLAVASLSRECEKRDNKRPIESDLRDAGQLESDAHCLVFLYRESKYSHAARKDDRIKNIMEVNVAKNRGGPTGRTLLEFDGARSWCNPVSDDTRKYYHNFLKGKEFLGEGKAAAGDSSSPAKPPGATPSKPKKTTGWNQGLPPDAGRQTDFMEGDG